MGSEYDTAETYWVVFQTIQYESTPMLRGLCDTEAKAKRLVELLETTVQCEYQNGNQTKPATSFFYHAVNKVTL